MTSRTPTRRALTFALGSEQIPSTRSEPHISRLSFTMTLHGTKNNCGNAMQDTINLWNTVANNQSLLDAASKADFKNVSAMSTLRKHWSQPEIAIAIELNDARRRASKKGCDLSFIADRSGIEQATSMSIATHKAKRFRDQEVIYDLCCGVGADLFAMPTHTIGIDINPLRCWMASQNTNKEVVCDDILHVKLKENCVIHIDPARRTDAGRTWTLEEMEPPIRDIINMTRKCLGGCIKLSPAVNSEDLTCIEAPFELEYIEEHGQVLQAVVWFGSLAQEAGKATATSLSKELSCSGEPAPVVGDGCIKQWILEPNPALERSQLHGMLAMQFDAAEIALQLGLFTSAVKPNTQWYKSFEVIEVLPLRLSKVKESLRKLKCTQVEVKTRGKVIDPNEWQKKLSTKSTGELFTLFALRIGENHISIITRRS